MLMCISCADRLYDNSTFVELGLEQYEIMCIIVILTICTCCFAFYVISFSNENLLDPKCPVLI